MFYLLRQVYWECVGPSAILLQDSFDSLQVHRCGSPRRFGNKMRKLVIADSRFSQVHLPVVSFILVFVRQRGKKEEVEIQTPCRWRQQRWHWRPSSGSRAIRRRSFPVRCARRPHWTSSGSEAVERGTTGERCSSPLGGFV